MPDEVNADPARYSGGAGALPLFSCSAHVLQPNDFQARPRAPMLLVVEQFLNGLQFGLLLFLLAAGLTLVFGIMDLRQSGAWLALHDGRLFRRDLRGVDREFPDRRAAGARRHAAAWHRAGIRRTSAPLRPRSSRSRAGDVRADPVLQRRGAADLGSGGPGAAAAGLADGADRNHARRLSIPPIGWRSSWSRLRWP